MPEKINGYYPKEVKELIAFLKEGKRNGKTLSALFSQYGKKVGRAAGSVRNYYYKLLKTAHPQVQDLLKESSLHAEEIVPFTEQEVDNMLLVIMQEKAKGYSIRKAILNVTDGDNKKMLRYQNKYRNLLQSDPKRIAQVAKQVGLNWKVEKRQRQQPHLQSELIAMYGKLTEGVQLENERLKKMLMRLEAENAKLKKQSAVETALQNSLTTEDGQEKENLGIEKLAK